MNLEADSYAVSSLTLALPETVSHLSPSNPYRRNPSIIPKPEADPVATQPGQPDGVEKETEEADT